MKEYSIYNTQYYYRLKSYLRFEVTSFVNRKLNNKKPKLFQDTNYLNLGCGETRIEDWVNADFYSGINFLKRRSYNPDWMLDLRYPLNCDSNVWDGVYTEHTLEHLYPMHAFNLLKELKRTLKPNGWIRIIVPDLKKYVKNYCNELNIEEFKKWETKSEAMWCLTQNYRHLSLWDSELLSKFLNEVGFKNIKEVEFNSGSNPNIIKDKEIRKWESLYFEAQKEA